MHRVFDPPTLLRLYGDLAHRLRRVPTARDLEAAHATDPERYPSLAVWAANGGIRRFRAELGLDRVDAKAKNLRRCRCGAWFAATTERRKWCTTQCRDRHRARRKRELRRIAGVCVKCGGPIDVELAPTGRPPADYEPHYCGACRAYWRDRARKAAEG